MENEESRCVGLWNLWEDDILHPQIELDIPAKDIVFYETDGYCSGGTVHLTKVLKPYECAFFAFKK